MKRRLLNLFFMGLAVVFGSTQTINAQCNSPIGMIGEFNGWAGDQVMDRDSDDPSMLSAYLFVTLDDDTSDPPDSIISMKFRFLGDWGNNWGGTDFPNGTGVPGGGDIPVPPGNYFVQFNCITLAYSFTEVCGDVSLIGEFNGWAGDLAMTRDAEDMSIWSTTATFTLDDDTSDPPDSIIEMKFRENAGWAVNWGDSTFPSGTAVGNGKNIPVQPGSYKISFNCETGEYNFTSTCGDISMIGEFNEWAGDLAMHRDETDPNKWTVMLQVNKDSDTDANDTIEVKFRANMAWAANWGGPTFPTGTGTHNGPNIMIPLDTVSPGLYNTYIVSFDCSTGAYDFQRTCGPVSMIGEFNDWNGDVPMNRSSSNIDEWTLTRSWPDDSQVKFRENMDWGNNWGDGAWPTGTATHNGDNIPLVAGTYDVSFNCMTGAYNFVANTEACGDIGLVGDFNNFGTPEDPMDPPTDVWMVRDANNPNDFSLQYNFTSSTRLLFRQNADPTFVNVWGGTSFPIGTGVMDPSAFLDVAGGKYNITFNCISGDYSFERLGNAVIAPQVFAINVDGTPNEKDWNIDQNVSALADGAGGDENYDANFGVVYTSEDLYFAVEVSDPDQVDSGDEQDEVHFFFDGDKSGGEYDDFDVYFVVKLDGSHEIRNGNASAVIDAAVSRDGDGYSVEASVEYASLGLDGPESGTRAGVDIGVRNQNSGGYDGTYIWNGSIEDTSNTSAFGDMLYGDLSCGEVSLYGDMIGDIVLRNPTDLANDYVGTYEIESDMNLSFRKDGENTVSWGSNEFPTGTAAVGGDAIPTTAGRYRIAFNCIDGQFSFTEDNTKTAYTQYAESGATIDGDLSEYNLEYGMDAGVVDGSGAENNTVKWGTIWDKEFLYIGIEVTDAVVEGSGNPWENDGMEIYIDGNHDQDGPYDADWDTQLIIDFANGNTVWSKADGVPIDSTEGNFTETATGFNIEMKVSWATFKFAPARNRSLGFTIGNNDSDNGVGRDYQTAWHGTANNWNDTKVFGDIQLAGGPLVKNETVYYNENVKIFPNPTSKTQGIYVQTEGEIFTGSTEIEIYNMLGQKVYSEFVDIHGSSVNYIRPGELDAGPYFVHIIDQAGNRALKKLVVQ